MSLVLDPNDPQACLERVIEALKVVDITEVARILNCTLLSGCPCREPCRRQVDGALVRFPADPMVPDDPEEPGLARGSWEWLRGAAACPLIHWRPPGNPLYKGA